MKKLRNFRNVFANIIIATTLAIIFGVTYAGGVLNVFSKTDTSVLYNGNLSRNNVTLMFNVYWGNEYIEPILDILDKNDIVTTFFVGGVWVSKNTDLFNEIIYRGHEIGNHGYFHKEHENLSYEKNMEEIMMTHKIVEEVGGIEMDLFAPPSGSFSNDTLQVCENMGYKTIMWTKDTVDWRDKDSDLIYSRAIKNAKGGDLILMHPTKCTLDALESIINYYVENDFNLTTVSENIAI